MQEAEAWVKRELAAAEWSKGRLKKEAKGHPFKLKLAKRLRAKTTMTVAWIARRLEMGTPAYLNFLLGGKRLLAKVNSESERGVGK